MKTCYYEIDIEAPAMKVYETMLETKAFEAWTAVFNPTSRLEGNWEVGSAMRFIATEPDGTVCGMLSRILENKPGEFLSMEHYGTLINGKEIIDDDAAKALQGLREEYTYTPTEKGTHLKVRTDLLDEWVSFMEETYPKAMMKIKELCENN